MSNPIDPYEDYAVTIYKTQKARGISKGWTLNNLAGYAYIVPPVHGVFPHIARKEVSALLKSNGCEIFARPCPVTPRHGFVESRVIETDEQFEELLNETLKADPDGEVLLMNKLTGKYSAIMTATGVTWGLSNDGVTSGKGKILEIPTPAGDFDLRLISGMGEPCDANNTGVYVELVEHNNKSCVVQMRFGPKAPDNRAKRYVVGLSRKIKFVLRPANDDLIAWDLLLTGHSERSQSTLVWLPGQSLSSHFAVQAMAKGFNVSVEDVCPVPSDFLSPTGLGVMLTAEPGGTTTLSQRNYAYLASRLRKETKTKFWDFPRDIMLSVGVLHSMPYWDGRRHLLSLRARGIMIAARYGLAACLGEARHAIMARLGTGTDTAVQWDAILNDKDWRLNPVLGRSLVFFRAFMLPWHCCADFALAAAEDMVLNPKLRARDIIARGEDIMNYKTSYRGPRWEYASLCVHDLIVAINSFIAEPNEATWNVLLGHYNVLISAVHNGGYLMNKWCSPTYIDNAARSPSLVFGFTNVMRLLFGEAPKPVPLVCSRDEILGLQSYYNAISYAEQGVSFWISPSVWRSAKAQGLLAVEGNVCNCNDCVTARIVEIMDICVSQSSSIYITEENIVKLKKIGVDFTKADYMSELSKEKTQTILEEHKKTGEVKHE